MRTRRHLSSSYPTPQEKGARRTHMVKREAGHVPVLLHESIEALDIAKEDVVVDATLGGAGHAREITARLGKKGVLVGIDADARATERAKEVLAGAACTTHIVKANFRGMKAVLGALGIDAISKALFDLGWSGFQLTDGRGFSFLTDDPLLMTYDDTPGIIHPTAATVVNTWAEESIRDIITGWGEERFSAQIARGIVARRAEKPFETARELADCIASSVPAFYRKSHTHPATKTFQAIRMAVNDEIGAIREGIRGAWEMLDPGGRIAVITFHSVEDREVKRLFLPLIKEKKAKALSKSPIQPSWQERRMNPRARSAKLRVIEKLPTL